MKTFSSLGLSNPILSNLQAEGYENPTPVQQQSIPIVLQGRDLLSCAQTGTGKTAAFGLPLLEMLSKGIIKNKGSIQSLILCPTRELAIQIHESLTAYGRNLNIKTCVIFGGVPQQKQERELSRGCDVLIATPGRLLDLMQQKIVRIDKIGYLVLDEADRMLDMGFLRDIKRILQEIPAQRQTLFFSATMPDDIRKLADSMLKNPAQVNVSPTSSTAEKINQTVFHVAKDDKKALLVDILNKNKDNSCLIFTRTKHGANRLVKDLMKSEITSEAIHGNKSQSARQKALSNFKSGKISVLIATDIAARGIDIDQLSLVINYELPNVPETYVHRIGRTGRAGSSGLAVSFCDHDEKIFLRDIEKLIKISIPAQTFGNMAAPVLKNPVVITQSKTQNQPKSRNQQRNWRNKPSLQKAS
jgi:ATP-dependent RNA helicase RhlE